MDDLNDDRFLFAADDDSDDDSDDDADLAGDDGSDDDSDDTPVLFDDASEDDDSSDDDSSDGDDSSDDDTVAGGDDTSDDDDSSDDDAMAGGDDTSDDDDSSDDDTSDDDTSDDDDSSDDDTVTGGDDRSDDDGLGFDQVLTIAYLYEAVLDRDGQLNPAGLNFWIDARGRGMSESAIAERFLFSDEFARRFGEPDDLDDRELVEVLYLNVLDRPGAQAGIDHWTRALARDDFDRADLVLAFARSPENAAGLDYASRLSEDDDGLWTLG